MAAPKLSLWDRLLWKRGRMRRSTMVKQAEYQVTLVCSACGHAQVWHRPGALLGKGRMRFECGYSGETYDPSRLCGCVVEGKLMELFHESVKG